MSNRKNERGFTLVELSIVLVIIGLIVGGVLAGQSLIRSARLQAEVTQFNKIDTAVNAFYLRFNQLPGDLTTIGAFATANVAGGNQDGYIGKDGTATAGGIAANMTTYTATEEANAQAELMELGLVPGVAVDPTSATANAIGPGGGDVMAAKLFPNSGIVLFGNSTVLPTSNNWAFYGINSGATPALTVIDLYDSSQVQSIDTKLDDGIATTGIVQTRDSTNGDLLTAGTTSCNTAAGVGGGVYVGTVGTQVCAFMIRLSQ